MIGASAWVASEGWNTSATRGCAARNAATRAAVDDRRACAGSAPSQPLRMAAARRQSRMPPRMATRSITLLARLTSLVGNVAPQIAIGPTERLRAAAQHDVHALIEQRSPKRPGRGNGRVDDETQARRPLACRGHTRDEASDVLGADQRVRERFREHERRLRADGPLQPVPIAVVHDRERATDPGGQPFQVAAGLVVDLPHEHGMAALRHQHVEHQGSGLHARVAGQRRARVFQIAQAGDERPGRCGAIPRVERRQGRPARLAEKHAGGLPLLPFDHALGPEQVELHGGLVGVQVGEA